MLNDYFEHLVNSRMDHELYGLKPQHRFFSQHPSVNDHLPDCICSGRIVVKGDVKRFVQNRLVRFEDESTAEVDLVLMCTGYNVDFPFLESPVSWNVAWKLITHGLLQHHQ